INMGPASGATAIAGGSEEVVGFQFGLLGSENPAIAQRDARRSSSAPTEERLYGRTFLQSLCPRPRFCSSAPKICSLKPTPYRPRHWKNDSRGPGGSWAAWGARHCETGRRKRRRRMTARGTK